MFFQRFYDVPLAQASYMIGCQRTGEALVVDPNRDVQQYIDAAAKEGLRITHVTETHIHADFVSGARELAERTQAGIYLSDEGGPDWKYGYTVPSKTHLVKDGDSFSVGNIRIEVMHTPGHTPEHISFLVTDTPAAAGPWGILTGDFVFVGDVGRPDLLEKAAGVKGTMVAGAHTLFQSLKRFRALPDHLQVWPGHGAGSACGKALGAVPSTTVGYEKIGNWGVATTDEDEFVRMVLDGQPEPPRYFAQMKRINKEGPAVLGGFKVPSTMSPFAITDLLQSGANIVDVRTASEYAEGHIPGTLNIPLNGSFNNWAGWLLPYDRDVYLLFGNVQSGNAENLAALHAVRELAMIGLDHVKGIFGGDALAAWAYAGHAMEKVAQASPGGTWTLLSDATATVIDVRGKTEWDAGHLPGVSNIPVGYLVDRIAELPTDRPVVLQCQGGARSSIAASVLLARGMKNVVNMAGGYAAWVQAGLPTERGNAEPVASREPALALAN